MLRSLLLVAWFLLASSVHAQWTPSHDGVRDYGGTFPRINAFHEHRDSLFCGTDYGIYRASDSGRLWRWSGLGIGTQLNTLKPKADTGVAVRRMLTHAHTYTLTHPKFEWIEQSFGWDMGSTTTIAMAYSGDESVVLTGNLEGHVTLGSISLSAQSTADFPNAHLDGFVAKYSLDGAVRWALVLGGGHNSSVAVEDIACDAAGNVYLCGRYGGSEKGRMRVGALEITTDLAWDGFVCKISPGGAPLWLIGTNIGLSRSAGHNSRLSTITCDATGNPIVAGSYIGQLVLGGESLTSLRKAGTAQQYYAHMNYVAKLNPDGSAAWARNLGESAGTFAVAYDIGSDGSGQVYLITHDRDGEQLVSLTSAGGDRWAKVVRPQSPDPVKGSLHALAVDQHGFATVFGTTDGSPRQMMYHRYAPDGSNQWAKLTLGNTGLLATDAAADREGNVYVTAQPWFSIGVGDSIYFGAYKAIVENRPGFVVAKIKPDGEVAWAFRDGTNTNPANQVLTVSPTGKPYLAGTFKDHARVGRLSMVATTFSQHWLAGLSHGGGVFTDTNIYIASINGVFVSPNQGRSWTIGNRPLEVESYDLASIGDTLFAAARTGTFRSIDHGESWNRILNAFESKYVRAVGDVLYADGYGTIKRSLDFGQTWTDVDAQLPIEHSNWVDTARGKLYALGAEGPFLSHDSGRTWLPVRIGLFHSDISSGRAVGFETHDTLVFVAGDSLYATRDRGEHWLDCSSGLPFTSILGFKRYYLTTMQDWGNFLLIGTQEKGIWRARYSELPCLDKAVPPLFQWATGARRAGYSAATSLTVDEQGYSYVAGHFKDTTEIGSSVLLARSSRSGSNVSPFIAKLDPKGRVVWAKAINGNGAQDLYSIVIGRQNDLYLAGRFIDTLSIGDTAFYAPNSNRNFLSRLDRNGEILWTREVSSRDATGGISSLAATRSGVVFTTRATLGDITFHRTTIKRTGSLLAACFRVDANGEAVWSRGIDHELFGVADMRACAVDSLQNVIITGNYKRNATVGDLEFPLTTTERIFLLKLDAEGAPMWVRTVVRPLEQNLDSGLAVAVDGSNNIYMLARSGPEASFDGKTPRLDREYLVAAKYSPTGDIQWVLPYTPASATVTAGALTVESSGTLYIAGIKNEVVGVDTVTNRQGRYSLLAMTSEGGIVWLKQVDAQYGSHAGSASVNGSGGQWIAGVMDGPDETESYDAAFGMHGLPEPPHTSGTTNMFVAKLGPDQGPSLRVRSRYVAQQNVHVRVYPDPARSNGVISILADTPFHHVTLTNTLGQAIARWDASGSLAQLQLPYLAAGVYVLAVEGSNFQSSTLLPIIH